MPTPTRTRRTAVAAAWVAAGAVVASALTGLASASTTSTGPSGATATTTASTRPVWAGLAGGGAARRGLLRTVLHGELTVRTASGTATEDVQRGTVTAASATSVSVASSDGFTATYVVGATTLVRRDRRTVTADALKAGDTVFVRATGGTAQTVRALSPDALTRLQDRLAQRRTSAGTGSTASPSPTTGA